MNDKVTQAGGATAINRRSFLKASLSSMAIVALSGCNAKQPNADAIVLAPIAALPKQMQDAPNVVRTAYRFAAAKPDALRNVPCYCGCGSIGHTSNLACYISEYGSDGEPVFADHALGCSLCVDIATDVMKMTGEGMSPADIRQQIVGTYSKFGPANQ